MRRLLLDHTFRCFIIAPSSLARNGVAATRSCRLSSQWLCEPSTVQQRFFTCATSSSSSVSPCSSTSAAFKRTVTLLGPKSFSHLKQKPMFPGGFREVTKFEGEHRYNYGLHTYTIFRESVAIAIIPAGCLVAYVAMKFPQFPVPSFELQVLYLIGLFLAARVVSRGRQNRIVKDLTGRHIVITGATSGIGKATAAQLAAMGANITVVSRDGPHVADALKYIKNFCKYKDQEELQCITFNALDLSDFIAIRDYCRRARQHRKPIDVLVNNAGLLQRTEAKTRFGDDMQLAVNFLGPYLLTEGLLPLIQNSQGRIVNVSCSAHVGIKGHIVSTYLTGRGVWSEKVAHRFDGLEQYGLSKLGVIHHAQDLAVRSYPEPPKQRLASRLRTQKDAKLQSGQKQLTSAEHAAEHNLDPLFTTCACTPGGVVTNVYRDVPLARTFKYFYYAYLLIMRSAWEGSQVVVNCCVRDELKNGGYYMNTTYQPAGLSKAACDVQERNEVMAWVRKKMQSYMKWEL